MLAKGRGRRSDSWFSMRVFDRCVHKLYRSTGWMIDLSDHAASLDYNLVSRVGRMISNIEETNRVHDSMCLGYR